MATLESCNASGTEDQCIESENHNRLMALYHVGTDVKRSLLQHYLKEKSLKLADYLSGKYKYLPSNDVQRVLRNENIQLSDLGIYAIDTLLTNHCYGLFWDCCLEKSSLENILYTHRKELYSLYQNSVQKEKYLSKKQWEFLYNGPEESVINEIGFQLSMQSPNKGLLIQSFDSDLNVVLLSTVCPLYKSVDIVTKNQMEISRIAIKQTVKKDKFEEIWDLMETNLIHISSHCICAGYYEQKFDSIKNTTYHQELLQENRKYILESTFQRPVFLKDEKFLHHVQEELKTLEVTQTKNLIKRFCEKEIPVLLENGQYKTGSYSLAIVEATRKDVLEVCQSVCNRQTAVLTEISASEQIDVTGEQKNIDRHNYMKLIFLIQDISKDVLVEILKGRLPGADYGNALKGMKQRLFPLLNGHQIQLLYPEDSKYKGDFSDIDISLLCLILRNLGTIPPHKNGWGKDPEECDQSMSANIDRIRIAKNFIVSHLGKCSIGYTEFHNRWKAIRQCCVVLGGQKFEERIDTLLTSASNCDLEQQISEDLNSLTENDVQIERHSSKIEEVLRNCIEQLIDTFNNELAFRCRKASTKNEASYTPLSLRIKGDNLPRTDELGNIRDYKNKDARVTALQDGSIIIYLEMSQSAFQTFEYALSVIDKLLQHAFLSRSVGNDKRAEWISISLKLYQLPGEIKGQPYDLVTRQTDDHMMHKRSDLIRIVVIGKTGAGKSSTGNTILNGRHFDYSFFAQSETLGCKLKKATVMGRHVSVVDTPGIFDPRVDKDDNLREIMKSIYMSAPGPHAVLYVIPIGRFTRQDMLTLEEYVRLFGENLFQYIIVVFTSFDQFLRESKISNAKIEDFMAKLPDCVKEFIINKCNARYVAFDNLLEGAKSEEQVLELFSIIDRMVDENGGSFYSNDDYRKAEHVIQKKIDEMKDSKESYTTSGQIRYLVQTSDIGSRIFGSMVSFSNKIVSKTVEAIEWASSGDSYKTEI